MCPLISPQVSPALRSQVGSFHLYSLTEVEGYSQKVCVMEVGVQHKQGGTSCSLCPPLLDCMSVGIGETATSFAGFDLYLLANSVILRKAVLFNI